LFSIYSLFVLFFAMVTMTEAVGPRLEDLARQDVPVAAWCQACGHHKVLPAGPLLERLDRRTAVAAVARRLSCSACGSRRIETRPHYAGLGVVAGHRWHGE
jgi:hypothetical protein